MGGEGPSRPPKGFFSGWTPGAEARSAGSRRTAGPRPRWAEVFQSGRSATADVLTWACGHAVAVCKNNTLWLCRVRVLINHQGLRVFKFKSMST